jgi:hypothetical protein
MAEAVETAVAGGASVSPDGWPSSSFKKPAADSGFCAGYEAGRAAGTEDRLVLQAVTNMMQSRVQPAAACTPADSGVEGVRPRHPAEALAELSQLAHKLMARIDQTASAGLGNSMAPVISRGDLGMIVPSPMASRGGSAVGRWQQGGMGSEL